MKERRQTWQRKCLLTPHDLSQPFVTQSLSQAHAGLLRYPCSHRLAVLEFTSTAGGNQHSVLRLQIHYAEHPVADYVRASVEAAVAIHEEDLPGDVLIFLTGASAICLIEIFCHRRAVQRSGRQGSVHVAGRS